MAKLVARWNGPHFALQKKLTLLARAHKKSLSKDGDVIEPQKRCEETWVVASGANVLLVIGTKKL